MRPIPNLLRLAPLVALMLVAVAGSTGCGLRALPNVPVRPPLGLIYSDVTAPLDYEVSGQPSPEVDKLKESRSMTRYVAVPFYDYISAAWGEAAIKRTADSQGITVIHYVDYRYRTILGIYAEFELIVRGE